MYRRTLDVRKLAERKSLFLFGPRSTGKTTLLRAQFDSRAIVNLLRSGVNLLGGRAWQANLLPLTSAEIPELDLGRYLLHGGLPQVYGAEYPEEELDAYVNTYLREEIRGEALVQNFVHFARFLNVAAVCNGQQLNFANVSRDTGVPATSVRSYFDILADTFIGFLLQPWRGSRRRKAVATAKFYFFDVGVANFLRGISALNRNSSEYGIAFEHFIAMELRSYLSYRRRLRSELTYWRTQSGIKVDFLVGSTAAIEVKASGRVTDRDLKGLRALAEEGSGTASFLVSFDELDRRTEDGIRLLHWRTFLAELWADALF